ncbi:galactosyltransferase-related protein [Blastopirellula marina]|uniref:Galactosyltransferase C-terminal domain-containing protein n=1 Tax=Blastopirellula marina DSM 3645 TaxID=314230 RepID=A4A263_9BACT|nr:hypothetical protein DSM3645_15220 [Blastopirellula marina DSM 3645]
MDRPVKVIVPWRPDESRQEGLKWVVKYYEHRLGEGCIHLAVDDSKEPFNKSKLLNLAIAKYPGHVIVIADADCIICDHSLSRAVREVTDEEMICPHNRTCRTTKKQARWILNQNPSSRVRGKWFIKTRSKPAVGGIWVITHELFMKHRMDERFEGWGHEDGDFKDRVPHKRYQGPLFHIWHPPSSRKGTRRNSRIRNENLRKRKREAAK